MDDPAAKNATQSPAIPPPAPVARTIGERLRAGRDRSGLSVPAAAEKLHLDPKVIEALEADRFAELGASVYVRGHLKRYGDFVGEPGAELVAMYTNREARAASPDLTQVPQPERRADPRVLQKPAIAIGSAAVLLAAIWWVLAGSRGAQDSDSAVARPTPVVPGDDVNMVNAAEINATPASLTASAFVPAAESAATNQTTATTPVAADSAPTVAVAAPARETRLRLELSSDSWVEVYDSRGQRLYADVASGGSVQDLSGYGPLRVILGVSAGVSVEVDGERREIPANAADGEGARFVVNRSGTLSRSR